MKYSKAIAELGSTARRRLSCYAAPDRAACAPFREERRMKCDNATKFCRKAGRRLASAGYHEPLVSLLWTKPVQLSLLIAKLSL